MAHHGLPWASYDRVPCKGIGFVSRHLNKWTPEPAPSLCPCAGSTPGLLDLLGLSVCSRSLGRGGSWEYHLGVNSGHLGANEGNLGYNIFYIEEPQASIPGLAVAIPWISRSHDAFSNIG